MPTPPTPPTMQARFAAALNTQSPDLPPGLCAWTGARPDQRFQIYRNNVRAGLVRALALRFPAVEKIVGPAFFAAMAGAFIARSPPRSPVLLDYGDDFPDFIAGFAAAAPVPYLADVALIEVARARAYHAADAPPVAMAVFAARLEHFQAKWPPVRVKKMRQNKGLEHFQAKWPPVRVKKMRQNKGLEHFCDSMKRRNALESDLAALRLTLHPSLGLVRSAFPAATIWAMNAGELPLGPIDHWQGEDALIVRPALTVLIHRLPPGGAFLIESLAAGADLGAAVSAVIAKIPDFDLETTLILLLRSESVIDLT